MRSIRRAAAFAALLVPTFLAAPAGAGDATHCAAYLQPVSTEGVVVHADLVELGCFATYAEAVEAGTEGALRLDDGAAPSTLSESDVAEATATAGSSVLIGTEWVETGYTSTSKSYFASATCSDLLTWEVGYVTDAWNDRFESGKGFGGCDRNRKFQHSQFGGSSILCTPNCSTYGALNDEVSSLRWTH
jgi:hypothetical protein